MGIEQETKRILLQTMFRLRFSGKYSVRGTRFGTEAFGVYVNDWFNVASLILPEDTNKKTWQKADHIARKAILWSYQLRWILHPDDVVQIVVAYHESVRSHSRQIIRCPVPMRHLLKEHKTFVRKDAFLGFERGERVGWEINPQADER